MYMSYLHALPSFLVYWCVLFCILSCTFVVSIKNLDLDWSLSGWGYGLAPLAYTVVSVISVPWELSGRKESGLRYEAVQHCGGVVWSV